MKAFVVTRIPAVARGLMKLAHNSELAKRYSVDDLPGAHMPGARLYGILEKIGAGQQITPLAQQSLLTMGLRALDALTNGRLNPREFEEQAEMERASRIAQASRKADEEEAEYCWTDQLQKEWHALEAKALTETWKGGGDAWNAVNASAHWRRAGEPEQAGVLTEAAMARSGLSRKLQSAPATTRGGAMRDQGRFKEAGTLGRQAHCLAPRDYRPCTLLGAVHLQLGDLAAGHGWYAKAEQLGASRKAIDQELRSLLARLPVQDRQRICDYFFAQDAERFAWVAGRREVRASRVLRTGRDARTKAGPA